MQYSRVSPLVSRIVRTSLSTTVRNIAQVRNLHIQAPAALYTVGHEQLRKSNAASFIQFRTYADKVVKVPQMAESISEGTLKQWVKKVGDYVHQDDEVATIETDKIDVTVNAPASGTIVELFANEEDNVSVGADFFRMELGEPKEGTPKKEEVKEEKAEEKAEEPKKEEPKKEEKKVEKKAETKSTPAPAPTKAAATASDEEKVFGSRNETRVKMNRMRLRIAERLKQSQETAASLTTFNEIDMTNLMKLRADYKDAVVKKHGIKFGFMSAFVKASAAALEEIPAVNASIDGADIVYHDFVDISVAVSTPKGLVTPVLRNVEDMNFIDVEKNIAELGKKARDNKITIEDMAGGTFTISNGGVFGSLMGTPIINLPQTAILGMHSIKERPIVVDGKIEIRPMMYVALTYDHRLVDGREAVTFLVKIKELVEDPRRFLLDV
ncbi:dihydrolipoyllysine-residue succinyltransferase E2 component [Pilobolus umbonatus]|nr:dihydrolipoyllysine-residue succinyltransferase E2 component [Pilobolus umbonatus]